MLLAPLSAMLVYTIDVKTLKSVKVMAQWISLSEAAIQYGVNEEDVRFWIEKREIAFAPVGTTFVVDDESIQELISQYQVLPTREYISSIIHIYENQFAISESYLEAIHIKELEVIKLEKHLSLMQKIQATLEKNMELHKTINRLKNDTPFKSGWVERLRKRLSYNLRKGLDHR